MKRVLLGFAACTLLMTSCSNNDVIENISDGQSQLSFSTGVGKQAATKAAELNNTSVTGNEIALYAYQESSGWSNWYNDTVTHASGKWELKHSVRFRNENKTKYITYSSKVKGALTDTMNFGNADFTNTYPAFTYTVATNSILQEDLIAGITEVEPNKTDITLGLRHILSQVNFGTRGYKGAKIQIQNIQINKIKNKGKYTYHAANEYPVGDWGNQDGEITYPYYKYNNTEDNTTGAVNPQPVVPADANKGDVYIFGDGGNWGPGKANTTFYPVGTSGAWQNYNTVTPQTGLGNSLMLLPQDLTADTKVTFEYRIQDVSDVYVAGTATTWAKGEFSLDFSTGTTSGIHYDGKWEQNFRYVYLIDFTDFLDGIALTFKVDVETYPWENYNKDTDDDGIVNIMAASQPSEANMNAATFAKDHTWYIASQSETDPTTFNPEKWAQVIRNETWNLSTYDFLNIDAGESFILDFANVIFNTKENPRGPTDPRIDTQIDLILPVGYTAVGSGDISVTGNTPPRYTVNMNTGKTSGAISITNSVFYNKPATLRGKIAAISDGETIYYKGTAAVNLTTVDNTTLSGGQTIIVKFTSLVIPTVGSTIYGNWTYSQTEKTATYTRNDVFTLTDAKTALKAIDSNGQTIKCGDKTAIDMVDFGEPDDLTNVTTVTVIFSTAATRTLGDTANGEWSNPSNDNKTYVWTVTTP